MTCNCGEGCRQDVTTSLRRRMIRAPRTRRTDGLSHVRLSRDGGGQARVVRFSRIRANDRYDQRMQPRRNPG
jgi:hypothetical protein